MLWFAIATIAMAGSAVAAAIDLKTTEIPDPVIFGTALPIIVIRAILSILNSNFWILVSGLLLGGIFLAIGFAMYWAGQWGGGDGKLLAVMGLALPGFLPYSIAMNGAVFLFNLFLLGAAYIIGYAFLVSLKNPSVSSKFVEDVKRNLSHFARFICFIAALLVGVTFSLAAWFHLPLEITLRQLPLAGAAAGLAGMLFLLWRYLKVVELEGFRKRIPTKELKPGDMLAEDLPKLELKSRLIRGLSQKEVKQIRKGRDKIQIREGVRFAPVFPAALLLTLLFKGPIIKYLVIP